VPELCTNESGVSPLPLPSPLFPSAPVCSADILSIGLGVIAYGRSSDGVVGRESVAVCELGGRVSISEVSGGKWIQIAISVCVGEVICVCGRVEKVVFAQWAVNVVVGLMVVFDQRAVSVAVGGRRRNTSDCVKGRASIR